MKKILLFVIFCIFSLVFNTGALWGENICVDPGGGGDYTNLQDALDYAETNGADDVIQVVQGIYTGNYNGIFAYSSSQSNSITLSGGYTSGCASRVLNPVNTVLSGGTGPYRVLALENSAGGDITVEGFTIINGDSGGYGGGIWAGSLNDSGTAGDITLTCNIIMGNSAYNCGGVYAHSLSTAGGSGGAITLTNNTIAGNRADNDCGGLEVDSYSTPASGDTITLTNNTITGNSAGNSIGGLSIFMDNNVINCYNNIIWGNTAPSTTDIYLNRVGGTANGYNNDYDLDSGGMHGTWDYGIGTNIDADPLFVHPGYWNGDQWINGNYHLRPNSPCIDKGHNSPPAGLPATDFEGDNRIIDGNDDGTTIVDMGVDEFIEEFPWEIFYPAFIEKK